ncbi:MAG TPA: tetratricopeptide repeat protein [Planctomycetes bacterium]|nr:tetratricopeptide repeat protein [Planctomycetota bacterium]
MRFQPFLLALPLSVAPVLVTAQEPAASDEVTSLVREGRALLDQGKPAEALPLFEKAARADENRLRTRMWVLRAWMDSGRSNDTLNTLDELDAKGVKGPEMDYLYGMAFARRAQQNIAAGVTDASIQINFLDAVEFLGRAVKQDAERFYDAHLALATAAWYTQDLETARSAAEGAVKAQPENGAAWLQLGKIAMSQFQVAQSEEAWGEEAEGHWKAAKEAFSRAVEAFGTPKDDANAQVQLSQAALELGHALVWKGRLAEAADAYAVAIGWNPAAQNYGQMNGLLTPPRTADTPAPSMPDDGSGDATGGEDLPANQGTYFLRALEQGEKLFVKNFGAEDRRDATLLWWLGWAQLTWGDAQQAAATLETTLEKAPNYTNTWFYLALARAKNEEWKAASDAIARGWDADPPAMVAAMQSNLDFNVWTLERLIGKSFEENDLARCALLAEVCAEAKKDDPRHWNNVGLFLRDEADAMRIAAENGEGEEPDPEVLSDLYERSYEAYSRALRLDPENPQLLNDTAVLLQYYLDRDLEKALEMYDRAHAGAEAALAQPDLDEDTRATMETVLRDSANNKALLLETMKGDAEDETSGSEDGEAQSS